jgi:hypothetical protein
LPVGGEATGDDSLIDGAVAVFRDEELEFIPWLPVVVAPWPAQERYHVGVLFKLAGVFQVGHGRNETVPLLDLSVQLAEHKKNYLLARC